MSPSATIPLCCLALGLEAAFGYPAPLYRALGHPVTWMGAWLAALERRLNRPAWSFGRRRAAGALALLLLLVATALATLPLQWLLGRSPAGVALLAVLAASLPAQRSLHDHVRDVAAALERDGLEAGRRAVGLIVGRDTAVLDEAGVARAAVESLAENFSDGVVAPAFWLALGGLVGCALYKAANTADSMVGHRTDRHAAFGWAAARLDDVVNLPASRLAALWILVAAALLRPSDGRPGSDPAGRVRPSPSPGRRAGGGSAAGAWRALRRDAARHRSPNAGWPEAAMAGALGLRLAGPRVYGAVLVEDAFMGDGRRDVGAADIRRALRLYRAACGVEFVALAALALALAR